MLKVRSQHNLLSKVKLTVRIIQKRCRVFGSISTKILLGYTELEYFNIRKKLKQFNNSIHPFFRIAQANKVRLLQK